MRNIKHINHWIAEVRDVVWLHKGIRMTKTAIRNLFTKEYMKSYFDDGLSPKEAFLEELSYWDEIETP